MEKVPPHEIKFAIVWLMGAALTVVVVIIVRALGFSGATAQSLIICGAIAVFALVVLLLKSAKPD